MILNGIDFGRVLNASGARGFYGEGYYWHRPLRPFGLDWTGCTFVAKTTTLEPRAGNMPLDGITPREWKPKCIKVNWWKGAVLNAVGLSGPGLEWLLKDGRWFERTEPFLLSFMAVDADRVQRNDKAHAAAKLIARARPLFKAPFGIEINCSCPNVGHDPGELAGEMELRLAVFRHHLPDVPLLPKINALMPVEVAREIASRPECAAIVVSNTIPWGADSGDAGVIDWTDLFGKVSPLAHLGGGGLSGAPLLPIVGRWVSNARRSDFPVPIVAGGGILSAVDAGYLFSMGAAAVELGSVAILRPWRVRGIVRRVNRMTAGAIL